MTTQRLLQFLSRSVAAVVFLFAFVGAQNAFAQTIYVSSTTGSDAFDGASATISGGSGPKATLAAAYGAAAAGNTISIEAGTYTENFDFTTAAKGVTVVVTASGAVTVATFTGTSTIAVTTGTVDLTGGAGSVAVSGGALTLTSGTLALGSGKLAMTAATTLTVTGGAASGNSPSYTGAVTANYTMSTARSAGTEIPANLNGGTLTVNGANSTTFPQALVAGSIVTAATATGTTTFSSAVTINGAGGIVHNGDDAVFGDITMNNSAITSTGGGADQTFTAGAITVSQSTGAAGGSFNNTSATSTATIASLTVNATIAAAGNATDDALAYTITNTGTMSVTGAITEGSASDADEIDANAIAVTNSNSLTVGASSSVSGAFNNTGGTLALGSTTFTLAPTALTPATHLALTNMGTVTGSGSTVVVSRSTAVPASAGAAAPAFDIAGNLTVSGASGIAGAISVGGNVLNSGAGDTAAAVRTGGNFTQSGNGDITAALTVGGDMTLSGTNGDVSGGGSFDVAGNATFGGTHAVSSGAGTNDIDGAVTFSGAFSITAAGGNTTIGSGTITSSGSVTIANGTTLTTNGSFDASNGGGFTADAAANSAADNATLAFSIARGSSATYTPGPNTRVDDLTFTATGAAGTATLTMGQSVFIDENFTTGANTDVSLGNFAIRMSGNTSAASIGGTVTTGAGQSGALTFEGTTTTLAGLGDISNILINVGGGNRMSVLAGTSVDFTGELTLFNGGITVAGGSDISPEGSTAEVRRNSAGAATTDITGAGSFNGDNQSYILSIFGGAAVTALAELAATGISQLNVEDAGTGYTTDKAATVGNVNVEFGATLTNGAGFDLTATGVVTNAGTVAGAPGDQLILTGDSQSHTNTGNMTADLNVLANGVSMAGTATLRTAAPFAAASLTNLIVGDGSAVTAAESITLTNIQQIDGTVTIASDGTASIGLVQDDGAGGTGTGDEGTVDGAITVANGGSLTWTSNVGADAAITVGSAPVGTAPTFDFNGNTVNLITAGTFTAVSNANLGSSGEIEADHAAATVGTNLDGAGAPTSALPGLDVDATTALTSATRVVGTTDIDAALTGGLSLTLSGTVHINAGVTNNVTIIGTDVMVQGAETLTGTLTINASNVNFTGDAVVGADALTVTGLFTQTAGNVDLNGVDLILQAGADYTAGTYTAQASTDEIIFNTGGAIDLNNQNWTIPNAVFDVAMVIDGNAGTNADVLTIGNRLELSVNLTAGNNSGAATPTGTINLGDGSGTFYLDADGGNIIDGGADGTINYGGDTWTVEYNGTATTGLELPNAIDTMIINAATQLADAKNVTVNTLDVNAGGLDIDNAGSAAAEGVTINDGGAFNAGMNAPIAGAQAPAVASTTNYTLTYDNTNTTTDALSWPTANMPSVVITPAGAGAATVLLHANRTASNLEVASGDTFDPQTFNITVNGNLDLNGNPAAITSSAGAGARGTLTFAGSAAQTLDGGLYYNGAVNVNNSNGLTLVNGNLNASDNNTNAACTLGAGINPLTLTAGTVTTGTNRVILCHQSTTDQGFNRNGTTQTGSIFGNVQVTVDGTASANTTDRVEFPLGDASGNYRPYAITFNTPNQLASDPVLVATYNASSPMGTNGLPIATTDLQSNSFNVGRYPEFHWAVTSTPTVTPSVDYDVEFRAAGYANFVDEDIERTRAIRRADGSTNNFWILSAPNAADNDNFSASNTEPVAVARNAEGAISGDGVLFTFGLETNLAATDPAALTLNAGNSEVIDLTTVFSGGGANYTYTVTGADGAVVTTSITGDNLTVTGAGAGADTFTVTIDDGFQSVDATVTVTVNAALAAGGGLSDVTVAGGSANADVDASGDFSGGTAPYTYAVATSDAAVVAVTVDANGVVTHTFGAAGTATVTVTQTDSEGDSVNSAYMVTVNSGLAAAGGLANATVEEGADNVTDVTGEFSGGNGAGTFTYTASSSDTGVATVAVSGSDVTATGVSPYVVTGGAVTADAAPATITVTATDDLGASTTSSYTVDVTPKLGNVDGSGGPSPASASATLNNFLGLATLTAKQATAADYNMDAAITPFDAALIFDAFFNGKKEIVANPAVDFAYGELAREANIINVPVQIAGDLADVVSASFATRIDPAMATIVGVTSELGEGWIVGQAVAEDGTVQLAIAGNGDIPTDGTIATIAIELNSADAQFNLGGEGAVNNNATMSIDAVEVAELPETFALHGNYPNPFNPTTAINFDLPQSADVEIQVIDMIGRQVMTLPATTIAAGANRTVQIDASQLASGPYFYRVIAKMESATVVETGRMMLVK